MPRSEGGEIGHVARARVRHHRRVNAPLARWLALAVCVAPACAPRTSQGPERHVEQAPAPAEPQAEVEVKAPPTTTPPAPTPPPGPLSRLIIGEGWGCVVDEAGELWCWGHGPVPAPPWQAVRVTTPGPVVAIASERESGSPAHHVTCAAFADADARCWQHSSYGSKSTWGPFVGTAGALDIAVHAQSGGTGSNFVCVRMPDDSAPCFVYFTKDKPEGTLRGIVDLEHAGRMLALGRGGRIFALLEPVGNYGQVELRVDDKIGTVAGARSLVESPFVSPVCALDERSALRCTASRANSSGSALVEALRAVPGPVRSIGLGRAHGCVVTGDGAVACAGSNRWGELGSGEAFTDRRRTEAAAIPGVEGVREVAVTEEQTCVMTATSVRCYGRNAAIDLLDQRSSHDLDARRIMSRYRRTCVVDGQARTWCWGEGVDGARPRRVHLPIGAPVAIAGQVGECFVDERLSMVCGALIPDPDHAGDLKLAADAAPRTIAAVGRGGDHAEVVRGKLRVRAEDLKDPILRGPVIDLAGTLDETCALSRSGEIDCWREDRGPWGTNVDHHAPAIGDATALAGQCALRSGGRVSCWEGATIRDTAIEGALRIVADYRQVCGLLPEGRLRCESLEQLGREPAVPVLEHVVDLAAGVGHWCAIVTGGKVECRGDNRHGELGTVPDSVSVEGREIAWSP
jgi:hypothetical protein